MINRLLILILLFILTNCSNKKSDDSGYAAHSKRNADTVAYLDFAYSKVIVFATVDPFDPNDLLLTNKMDLSKFHDTISITLDSSQIILLADILSGKLNKDTLPDPADCHNPRHNIAFLNEKDSVVNYISVCFECHTMKSSKTHKASFNNLADFFNAMGLQVFEIPDQHKHYYDSINKLRPHRKQGVLKNTSEKFTPPVIKDGS